MGDDACAGGHGGLRRGGRRIAVPKAHHDAGSGQAGDLIGRRGLGGEGDQQRGQLAGGLAQARKVRLGHRPDQRDVMRTLAPRVEVRTLQMQAQKPRQIARGNPGGQNGCGRVLGIGNQRRQHRGRAKRAVRRQNARDPGDA